MAIGLGQTCKVLGCKSKAAAHALGQMSDGTKRWLPVCGEHFEVSSRGVSLAFDQKEDRDVQGFLSSRPPVPNHNPGIKVGPRYQERREPKFARSHESWTTQKDELVGTTYCPTCNRRVKVWILKGAMARSIEQHMDQFHKPCPRSLDCYPLNAQVLADAYRLDKEREMEQQKRIADRKAAELEASLAAQRAVATPDADYTN